MKKAGEIILQILLMEWPNLAAVVFMLVMNIAGDKNYLWIIWPLMVSIALLLVFGAIKAFRYRKEKSHFTLALFGVLQKLAILPLSMGSVMILASYKVLESEGHMGSGDSGGGGLGLLITLLVGAAIFLVVGLVLICTFIMFVESAIYMCCAIGALSKVTEFPKTYKVLLIIGSCIPVVAAVCAIVILIWSIRVKNKAVEAAVPVMEGEVE